jgi:hypothetical protein
MGVLQVRGGEHSGVPRVHGAWRAFGQTGDGQWCHIDCARWLPEQDQLCYAGGRADVIALSLHRVPEVWWVSPCSICDSTMQRGVCALRGV